MLHFIRERAKGWVAWIIIIFISIPFALWGVNSYFDGTSDVPVAKVDGHSIKRVEFQREYQRYRERLREVMGDDVDVTLFDSAETKQRVLDNMIEASILSSVSDNLGQYASLSAIDALIQSTTAFQRDGRFDIDQYRLVLARAGLTPIVYEEQLRRALLAQELSNHIKQTALITPQTLDNLIKLERQTRNIAYGAVSIQPYIEKVTVSDDDAKQYFHDHKTDYVVPEQIAIDYVELSTQKLAQKVKLDDASLQQFYDDNKDKFVAPEQRRVSHILIEAKDDDARVQKQLAEVINRLKSGDSFSELANQFSQDVGSASNGGDLGWLQPGVIDEAFDEAVFAITTVGEVSKPVKTEFGYHLIKLTGIQEPEGMSYQSAYNEIKSMYRLQKAEDLFYENADKLADLSYENPDSLDVVAKDLDLTINTSELFSRSGLSSGISRHNKVVEAAFSDDVLNDLNSEVIKISDSHLVVLRKHQHNKTSQLAYESVSATIKEKLRFKRARDKARQQGEILLAKLKSGEEIDALFTKSNWVAMQTYSRTSEGIDPQILDHAFSSKKPVEGTGFSGLTVRNGDYIVVALTAVNDGKPSEIAKQDRDNIQSYLAQIYGESEWQALVDSLKADASINILTKNMQ